MDNESLAKELLELVIKNEMLPFQRKFEHMAKGELLILSYLTKHGGGILPSEISRKVNVSSARITAIVNSLEKKEMIVREFSSHDRREVHLFITDTGRDCLQTHYQEAVKQAGQLLDYLGEEDAAHLIRITRRMLEFSQ